jgi:hypothetical protein
MKERMEKRIKFILMVLVFYFGGLWWCIERKMRGAISGFILRNSQKPSAERVVTCSASLLSISTNVYLNTIMWPEILDLPQKYIIGSINN